jgi:hypothetical protein
MLPLGLIHGSYRGKLWILIHGYAPRQPRLRSLNCAAPPCVSFGRRSLQDSSTEQMPIAARAYSPFAS